MAYLEVHGTTYHCTYNHIRALRGLISGAEVQLQLVKKYHEPPSRNLYRVFLDGIHVVGSEGIEVLV